MPKTLPHVRPTKHILTLLRRVQENADPAAAPAAEAGAQEAPLPVVTPEQEVEGLDAHKKALMPRKHRKVYESFVRRKAADRQRVAQLEGKRAQLAAGRTAGAAPGQAAAEAAQAARAAKPGRPGQAAGQADRADKAAKPGKAGKAGKAGKVKAGKAQTQ